MVNVKKGKPKNMSSMKNYLLNSRILAIKLSSITSARIVSSHLNQTSPSVDSNCPWKYQNVSITDIEAIFDIREHIESISSYERRKDLCWIQHLSYIGKTKPVSCKKAKGVKLMQDRLVVFLAYYQTLGIH